MLFTFKRDEDGRVTVEVGGLAIARITNDPECFEWINSMLGITAEHVREAAVKADEAGFWERLVPVNPWETEMTMRDEVTVDVPVAETTSTILSVDMSEEQA